MNKNHGKIALITGASKGIGKDIAMGLSSLGYTSILIGRNENDLMQVAKEIYAKGYPKPVFYVQDITYKKHVKIMIEDILSVYGRIDILVNNAGIHRMGTLDLSAEDFRDLLDTNITGHFLVTKAVVPVMKKQGSGYIFNVASRSAKVGFAGTGGYCASKFGLLGLSESLYRELIPQGIKVTALCPAWVNTDMADRAGSPLEPEQRIQTQDLFHTIEWLLNLSEGACVKEVEITNPGSL